jgi:hypothetical protein
LRIDGRKVQRTREIATVLARLQPEPRLVPEEPGRRAAVDDAEQWGDLSLQPLARRVIYAALARDYSCVDSFLAGARLALPRPLIKLAAPVLVPLIRRQIGSRDYLVRDDLRTLPALLDRIAAWIADGVLAGQPPNGSTPGQVSTQRSAPATSSVGLHSAPTSHPSDSPIAPSSRGKAVASSHASARTRATACSVLRLRVHAHRSVIYPRQPSHIAHSAGPAAALSRVHNPVRNRGAVTCRTAARTPELERQHAISRFTARALFPRGDRDPGGPLTLEAIEFGVAAATGRAPGARQVLVGFAGVATLVSPDDAANPWVTSGLLVAVSGYRPGPLVVMDRPAHIRSATRVARRESAGAAFVS